MRNIIIIICLFTIELSIEMFDLSVSSVTTKHLNGYSWIYPFKYIKSRMSSYLMLNLIYTSIIQYGIAQYSSCISQTTNMVITGISLYLNVVLRSCVLYHPAPVAYVLSYIAFIPGFIFQWAGWLLAKIGYVTIRILGIQNSQQPLSFHSYRKELLWDIGENYKFANDMEELKIIKSALQLRDVEVYKIMTEYEDFVIIEIDQPVLYIMTYLRTLEKHRNLIAVNQYNEIVGTINKIDILEAYLYNPDFNITTLIKPRLFVSQNTTINAVTKHFVNNSKGSLFVIDHNTQIVGIVTLHDLVQELFGIDDDDQYFHATSNGYIMDADYNIRILNRKMNWNIPDQYVTVGDFIVFLLKGQLIPHQSVTWSNMTFTIISIKHNQPFRIAITITEAAEIED